MWTTDRLVWMPIWWYSKNELLDDWMLQACFPFRISSHTTPFLASIENEQEIDAISFWFPITCYEFDLISNISMKDWWQFIFQLIFNLLSSYSSPSSNKTGSFFQKSFGNNAYLEVFTINFQLRENFFKSNVSFVTLL